MDDRGYGGGPVELYVDLDALGELAHKLAQVKAALERSGTVADSAAGCGSPRVEEAVEDYIGGWRDGRRKIIEGIDGELEKIRGAADAYREQEAMISKAARGGS